MAFVDTPTLYFAGWSEDGTDITLPLANVTELTAAEADAATGDIRKIIYALSEEFYVKYNATAEADRPGKMTLYRSSQVDDATGEMTRTYSFVFAVDGGAGEVADED